MDKYTVYIFLILWTKVVANIAETKLCGKAMCEHIWVIMYLLIWYSFMLDRAIESPNVAHWT